MGSTRWSFTEEYKAPAVKFVLNDGRTIAEVARNISTEPGLVEGVLSRTVQLAADIAQPVAGSYPPSRPQFGQLPVFLSMAKASAAW